MFTDVDDIRNPASLERPMLHAHDGLAADKRRRTIVFQDIPKTSTGKIQKFKLREMAKAA